MLFASPAGGVGETTHGGVSHQAEVEGLLFGIYPAARAAKLHAMRTE
jgi:hypothetical protein